MTASSVRLDGTAVVSGSAKLTKEVADAVYANLVKLNLLGIDQGPALPERQTAAQRFASNVGNPLAATLARDGAVSPEQRKWRANFTSTYDFKAFEHPVLSRLAFVARYESTLSGLEKRQSKKSLSLSS